MSSAYSQLLDATIAHLETLKCRGVGWVSVRRETLASIGSAPQKPVPPLNSREAERTARPRVLDSANPSVPMDRLAPVPPIALSPSTPVRSEAALARWSKAAAVYPSASSAPKTLRVSTPLPAPLPPETRVAAMAELQTQILGCSCCSHLAASRHSVVVGSGDCHAKILFVGEAPGVEEDLSGHPFVGPSGELLTKILIAMGLGRESVFLSSILKCRPDTPGESVGNRKPRPEEVSTCIPWLDRQIDLIQPQVLVALGASAAEGLLGKGTASITQLRGS